MRLEKLQFSQAIELFDSGDFESCLEIFHTMFNEEENFQEADLNLAYRKSLYIYEKKSNLEMFSEISYRYGSFLKNKKKFFEAYQVCQNLFNKEIDHSFRVRELMVRMSFESGHISEFKKNLISSLDYCLDRKLFNKGIELVDYGILGTRWGFELNIYRIKFLILQGDYQCSIENCKELVTYLDKKMSLETLEEFQKLTRDLVDTMAASGVNFIEPPLFKLVVSLELLTRYRIKNFFPGRLIELNNSTLKNIIKLYVELRVLFQNKTLNYWLEQIIENHILLPSEVVQTGYQLVLDMSSFDIPNHQFKNDESRNRENVIQLETDYFYNQYVQYTSFENDFDIKQTNVIASLKEVELNQQSLRDLFVCFLELQFYFVCRWILEKWNESELDSGEYYYYSSLNKLGLKEYALALDDIDRYLNSGELNNRQYLAGLYQKALLFEKAGRKNRALVLYKKIVEMSPKYRLASEKIEGFSKNK